MMALHSLRCRLPGRQRNLIPIDYNSIVKEEDEDEEFLCRFCWQPEDDERGGELLAPCRCSGSVKYIHRRCLGAWQRTQRSQGALRKSYRCDICKERYHVRRAPFSGAQLPFGRLPTAEEGKELVYSVLGSPLWQVAFDLWKIVLLINGGYFATYFGIRGLKAGCLKGWKHVLWYITSMKSCGAEIAVLATVFKVFQFVLHGIAGFYCAALFGFAQGSSQVLRVTTILAWGLCSSGAGFAIKALGRPILRSLGLLRNLLPFFQQLGAATIMQ